MASVSVQDALQQIYGLVARAQFAEAEKMARTLVRQLPRHSAGLIALGRILEKTGRVDEATRTYEEIIRHHPGHGLAFTRRSLALLRRHWGDPPAARAARPGPRVSCATLGTNGRFANQLFQYAATRLYAHAHRLDAEFPDWIGRDLFDLDDPLLSAPLPSASEDDVDILGGIVPGQAPSLAGHDLTGYFQRDTALYAPWRKEFIGLFRPGRKLDPAVRRWRQALRLDDGGTLVALHLRRGDFGTGEFWIAPEAWYLAWLEAIWPSLGRPVLYVATDDDSVLGAFSRYNPISARDLGDPLPGAEFFADFYTLTQASHLAISNSSFSFIAAMLNARAAKCLRPEKIDARLVPFDPWSSPVLLRYPG